MWKHEREALVGNIAGAQTRVYRWFTGSRAIIRTRDSQGIALSGMSEIKKKPKIIHAARVCTRSHACATADEVTLRHRRIFSWNLNFK